MKRTKKKYPAVIAKVNSHRKQLQLSWSELADRYCIDRKWMREFITGKRKMHPSFATSLSEDVGVDITFWTKGN